ncbi:alanine racemase [Hyphomonas johnsonii]|uniref:Alanine racemase n=1 Tax=Hyphomonas johnsonii MHS-2 TaxID=1280950 RepID=A0A059FT94_9PROT|nr:alanine racemase [Hyphomonas johnsonii]KCZ93721.1 alanine racemase [Hyphomonas johnsonii MHS-2]
MNSMPRATIHLSNIVANWLTLDALHPGTTTAAVVKADAYGLGAVPVARALLRAGCSTFFVVYLAEGLALRKALGLGPRILVLNGPRPGEASTYKGAQLTAVLSNRAQAAAWATAPKGSCAIQFDTGMNRLGFRGLSAEDAAGLRKLQPVLVMTHLACADDPGNPMNARQRADFDAICESFADVPASISNSAGCYLGRGWGYDLTRPGIALYGGSVPPEGVTIRPGVTLDAEILCVSDAKAGETVGYGATQTLTEDTRLATVSIGYADGLLRSGSGKLLAYIGDVACPVVGRISMDLTIIDVTKAQDKAKAGVRVEFIGEHAKLEDQAARAGTLGYELLTGLSNRVERVYA